MDLRELYQQVILDHNRSPRNFRIIEDADGDAEGYNPLCGDRYHVYVNVDAGRIRDVAFQGQGCAISKASASLMTDRVTGLTRDEVERALDEFRNLVSGEGGPQVQESLGKLAVFSGVQAYPTRAKCALLPWQTLRAALRNEGETATTE